MSVVPAPPVIDFHAALARWTDSSATLAPPTVWLTALQHLGVTLGGAESLVERFVQAWSRLYSATLLLDHLQDDDELGDAWLATQPEALQYHLAFSAYALANRDLAELASALPPTRGLQLHELWSTTVLQMAIGQYRDLSLPVASLGDAQQALDAYEELAAQKTGAAFALALGGCVQVATDDVVQIDAAVNVGLLLGMLLQYYDDLLDRGSQAAQPGTLTLARAWAAQLATGVDEHSIPMLWILIYGHYHRGLNAILVALPDAAQAIIRELVQTMFGPAPDVPIASSTGEAVSVQPA